MRPHPLQKRMNVMKQNKMTLSFATKLHMLLILIVIAIGIYMFLLYKEVKIFQDELTSIKASLARFSSSSASSSAHGLNLSQNFSCRRIPKGDLEIVEEDQEEEEEEDAEGENDESVTSQEIKEMLSAIQKEPEEEEGEGEGEGEGEEVEKEEEEVEEKEKVIDIILKKAEPLKSKTLDISFSDKAAEGEGEEEKDYSGMTSEELQQVKYEELRSFLKRKGQVLKGKGTKADLIKKIGELFCV